MPKIGKADYIGTGLKVIAGGLEDRRKQKEEFSRKLQEAVFGSILKNAFDPEAASKAKLNDVQARLYEQIANRIGTSQPAQTVSQQNGILGSQSQSQPQWDMTGANIGPSGISVTLGENPANRQIGQDKSGLATLASESIRNIRDVRKTLFPSGDVSSFRRGVAASANIPLGGLPGVPNAAPFSEHGQDINRRVSAALAGRQLIQSGVAVRPDETKQLYAGFAPGFFSNAQASLNALNELEAFYENYLTSLTTGKVGGAVPGGNPIEQQISSQLPPGSKIKSIRRIR